MNQKLKSSIFVLNFKASKSTGNWYDCKNQISNEKSVISPLYSAAKEIWTW